MIKVHTTVKHVTPYCNPSVEDSQRFGRFVFFCVWVLIVRVLSLSSPSSKKSSSRKKSCCVSVPRVLQQVVHCKTTHLLKGGTDTHKSWRVKVIILINCTQPKRPHIFHSPLSLQRTNRNSAAVCFTPMSTCVMRRTSLFLTVVPISGLLFTSFSGGSTLKKDLI